jgi:hypothetical protein
VSPDLFTYEQFWRFSLHFAVYSDSFKFAEILQERGTDGSASSVM